MTRAKRVVIVAVAGAVACIAAWVSYWHGVEVCLRAGEHISSAHLIPLLPDASMIMGGVVHSLPGGTRKRNMWSRIALFLGIGASVGANILAADRNPVSMVVAALPALVLLAVAEMLMSMVMRTKPARRRRAPAKSKAAVSRAQPARARRLAAA